MGEIPPVWFPLPIAPLSFGNGGLGLHENAKQKGFPTTEQLPERLLAVCGVAVCMARHEPTFLRCDGY